MNIKIIFQSHIYSDNTKEFAMMDRLSVFVFFSIIFGVASDALLNYPVKEVHFKKLTNGSDEYEFEYDLDNGDSFRGQTYSIYSKYCFLFGAENEIYWTFIDSNEYKEGENFTKMVRKAEREEDRLKFEDDYATYYMSFKGYFFVYPYLTEWNISNTCFTKADNQSFNFRISASNNSRKYNGTTYRETDDPKVQRIHVEDPQSQQGGVYEFHFTDIELLSNEEFCRFPDNPISLDGAVLSTVEGMWANPNLLKSLVG